jgi:hypothetical protein
LVEFLKGKGRPPGPTPSRGLPPGLLSYILRGLGLLTLLLLRLVRGALGLALLLGDGLGVNRRALNTY